MPPNLVILPNFIDRRLHSSNMASDVGYSASPRGGSSVVSRPRHHRSKRSHRSHVGAPNQLPQNEFPVFSLSGDVEIVISVGPSEAHTKRYVLHKHTLLSSSGYFEASLSADWDRFGENMAPTKQHEGASFATIGKGIGGPGHHMWRYELEKGREKDEIPMLVQVQYNAGSPTLIGDTLLGNILPSSYAKKHSASHAVYHAATNGAKSSANLSRGITSQRKSSEQLSDADEALIRDYDNMFRVFYNYAPVLDCVSIADAYVQCKSLLSLAEMYDALDVMGPRVDHHLLQFQWRLWKQVAKYPISYLRLGLLARSRTIFQEAVVHVVGQWPSGERTLRSSMPSSVMDMIDQKVMDLEDQVGLTESRLFHLTLTTKTGEPVTPITGLLDWLAVSLFRDWLVKESSDLTHAKKGNVQSPLQRMGRVYRTIGSDPRLYLHHDDCKRFLKAIPDMYNRENLRKFEGRLADIKDMARNLVKPLMESYLQLEAKEKMSYLTCTVLTATDLPWPVED